MRHGHRRDDRGRVPRTGDEAPEGAMPLTSIDGCVAKAIYALASDGGRVAYIGESTLKGCCPGGRSWLGYRPFAPDLEHFISQGDEGFRGGRAEHLKRSPGTVRDSWARMRIPVG